MCMASKWQFHIILKEKNCDDTKNVTILLMSKKSVGLFVVLGIVSLFHFTFGLLIKLKNLKLYLMVRRSGNLSPEVTRRSVSSFNNGTSYSTLFPQHEPSNQVYQYFALDYYLILVQLITLLYTFRIITYTHISYSYIVIPASFLLECQHFDNILFIFCQKLLQIRSWLIPQYLRERQSLTVAV